VAEAGDGALAANIQGFERVELPRLGNADAHAELQLHARVRNGRLHATQLEWWSGVLIEVWKDGGGSNCFGGIDDRRACPDHAGGGRNRLTVFGDKLGARAVVGLRTVDIGLHHTLASRVASLDRFVNIGDGGLFDMELALLRPDKSRRQ